MKTPIFIYVENSYLDIYDTVQTAEHALEVIDVKNNLYKGFDADGCLLNIKPYEGRAQITQAELYPTHQSELIDLLKVLISKANPEVDIKDDLSYLISILPSY